MNKALIFIAIIALLQAFNIEVSVPKTNIGNESIACHPNTDPQITNGFATYFSDNVYACEKWNHKAKSLPDCFVAINGVCGMSTSTFCDKCVSVSNANGQS